MEAFEGHDVFFITHRHKRTVGLPYRKYLVGDVGASPLSLLRSFPALFRVLARERPDIMLSTGDAVAVPSFLLAKAFGIPTTYIESWSKVETTSGTGRLVYHIADEFLVQWPQLREVYGEKAKYEGAVI
jgi:UDP-N-acetylglucosamine:LPS N-acetylglucosamine transferase